MAKKRRVMARLPNSPDPEQAIEQARRTGVVALNLSGLDSLPDSIGRLTKLKRFSLSNELTSLPESIGTLTQLRRLNVCTNRLTSLPESLSQLNRLTYFHISSNRLGVLPDWIGRLPELECFSASSILLTEICDSLWGLL